MGEHTQIMGQVYIGENVQIGSNCTIHAGVKIYANCVIKNHVIIHANTVIGSDGFGFAPNADGTFSKIPQLGNVVIGDHVEIGSNCCIDRATMGNTLIENGVKLDNLIQIAHNVVIGKNTVIAAQTGVSGSTKIGASNMIGGQVGIVGHIHTAEGVKIQAQSGVNKSITAPGQAVYGSPALDYKDFVKSYVVFRKLPELQKKLDEIAKK
jgi:UDP-3-O-[3-hydroxymyristoyl] glucosamine N-acyltransferase